MSQYPSTYEEARPSTGLAIAALVCAILGMCIPGLGIIGLILGIIAMVRGSSPNRPGFGLALAAIIVGAISIFTAFLTLGILLPALGKARQTVRQLKSSVQLRQIDVALMNYASDNKGALPEAGADWQGRLGQYGVNTDLLVSPRAENSSATDSYIYIPGYDLPSISQPGKTVIAYENPKYVPRGLVNIAFADGHVEAVPVADLQRVLDASPKPGAPSGTPTRRKGR